MSSLCRPLRSALCFSNRRAQLPASILRNNSHKGFAKTALFMMSGPPPHVLSASPTRPSGSVSAASFGQAGPFWTLAQDMASKAGELVDDKNPVVSAEWLHEHITASNVKILDASWFMPAEKRNPLEEYLGGHIPRAMFFDLDGIIDPSSELPHMLPSEAGFAAAASCLGISNDDCIVVYDGKGIFSAARVWWMFRAFGHVNVWVLDGGFPQWRAKGFTVDSSHSQDDLTRFQSASSVVKKIYDGEVASGCFKAQLDRHLVWSIDQVEKNIDEGHYQLIDARSKPRFDGSAPEPRVGVRGGHVPGSKNIPFTEVLTDKGTLLPSDELQEKFNLAGVSLDSPVVASCGTGVTACILALALFKLGKRDVAVYDGSWTEWGLRTDTPVATNILSTT